jgi:hypothetical protein
VRFARSLSVASVIALVVAFVLATSVAAASTQVSTLRSSCTTTGGLHGSGYIELKVRATEMGRSGVTHIRFVAWLEHQSRADGGDWLKHQKQARTTNSWANTKADHDRAYLVAWDLGGDSAVYWHRIRLTVRFLDGSGDAVATHHVISAVC